MKTLPNTESLATTMSDEGVAILMFTAAASATSHIIAPPKPPTMLSEHLRALFMAVTAYYQAHLASNEKIPASMRSMLLSMYAEAGKVHGAHKRVLVEALEMITGSRVLLSDRGVRDAIAGCAAAIYRAA